MNMITTALRSRILITNYQVKINLKHSDRAMNIIYTSYRFKNTVNQFDYLKADQTVSHKLYHSKVDLSNVIAI